jgi:hypothetical protein
VIVIVIVTIIIDIHYPLMNVVSHLDATFHASVTFLLSLSSPSSWSSTMPASEEQIQHVSSHKSRPHSWQRTYVPSSYCTFLETGAKLLLQLVVVSYRIISCRAVMAVVTKLSFEMPTKRQGRPLIWKLALVSMRIMINRLFALVAMLLEEVTTTTTTMMILQRTMNWKTTRFIVPNGDKGDDDEHDDDDDALPLAAEVVI